MSLSIKIENLYKEYRLGLIGYGTLYKDLQSWWAKLRNLPDPNSLLFSNNNNLKKQRFLALKNINLEVMDGEVLGVIGANGAGKSTLLKILANITAPTSGRIRYKGRISGLLEVGTGFHPELTGRENIFLNGTINGMTNSEVSKKLDQIVDFAGVEKFLDTPVKRYSSGMEVRLGFAVAAHLDPDILLVDEVLAVGDASFREKAINKMKSVTKTEERTVLFVSHNMDSIRDLCTKAILLKDGRIVKKGNTKNVVNEYLKLNLNLFSTISKTREWDYEQSDGNEIVRLIAIRSKNRKGDLESEFHLTQDFTIEVDYMVLEPNQIAVAIDFTNENGTSLFGTQDDYVRGEWGFQKNKLKGLHRAIYQLPKNLFNTGIIFMNINIYQPPSPANFYHLKKINVFVFKMIDPFNGDGARGSYPYHAGYYALRPKIECTSQFIGSD